MLHLLGSIAWFSLLATATFGLGRPLLRWIGAEANDRLTITVFSIGLGLTASGLVLLAMGLTGILYVPLIVALTVIAGCWGLVEIILLSQSQLSSELPSDEQHQPLTPPEASSEIAWPAPPRWLFVGVLAAATAVCVASLLGALAPPTTDATLSPQLESAKRFLVEHRIVDLPAFDRAARPLLVDLWYLWALAFDDGVCAQLVHWGLGILLLLATVALTTPLLGRRWAWLAGGLVAATPAINQQMSLPVESVALAALATLALAAWWLPAIHGADRRWFIVAGLIAGGAFGVHYAAALLVPAIAMAWAWAWFEQLERRRFLLQGGILATLIAIGAGALCSLPAILPAAKSWCLASAHVSPATWTDHLGIVVLAAAPGLLLARRLRGLGTVLSAALVYTVLVIALSGDSRLLFPAVPLFSVAAVWVWIELRRLPQPTRRLAVASFAILLTCSVAISLVRPPDALPVAIGMEDREDYLARCEPTYAAAAVANRMLGPNAHILSQEHGAFYFNCRVTCENSIRSTVGDRQPVQEAVQRLRDAGFTHLLLAKTEPAALAPASSPLNRLADALPPLTEYCFHAADGSVRHYRLAVLR